MALHTDMYSGRNIDDAAMREHAFKKSKGDERSKPIDVTLHLHSYFEECTDKEHEVFPAQEHSDD